jgi:hypothetical protein
MGYYGAKKGVWVMEGAHCSASIDDSKQDLGDATEDMIVLFCDDGATFTVVSVLIDLT